MPKVIQNLLEYVRENWNGPGRWRLLLMGGALLGGVALVVLLGVWASQPDWAPLYSDLAEVEAAKVVESLETQKVPYKLTAGGTTVMVPRSELYRLRIKLAADGGPHKAIAGYELLDQQRLGISDRELEMMQKRALEGELARTLAALDWIEAATVHIVQPRPSLFSDEEVPVTASVTLVTNGLKAPASEVQSVVALVAASVENLDPSRVTVVDSRGRLLNEASDESEFFTVTNKQLELNRHVDSYLTRSGQQVMDQVLGPGRSVVRVAAELDFTYLERTSRLFDPEKRSVRSQESNEESATGQDTTATNQERRITNYEVDEILEHSRGQQGALRRLTVSLVVDGTYVEVEQDGEKTMTYMPRSDDEMNRLSEVLKAAVGYNASRGDEISAMNIAFDNSEHEDQLSGLRNMQLQSFGMDLLRKAIFVVGIIVFLITLRNVVVRVNRSISVAFDDKRALILASARGRSGDEPDDDMPLSAEAESQRSPEQRQLIRTHRKVVEFSKEHPEEAARLVRTWLLEA